jgi:hypothetical protein
VAHSVEPTLIQPRLRFFAQGRHMPRSLRLKKNPNNEAVSKH